MIRECTAGDVERIHFVVNEAAQAYKGVVPDDCWHEPYMPLAELRREMRQMTFFGWDAGEGLNGVMAQYIAAIDARIPTGVVPWPLEDVECPKCGGSTGPGGGCRIRKSGVG